MFLPGRCCRRCPHLLLAASSKTFKRKCIVVLQNGQRLILNIYFHLSWTQAESGGNYQVRCVNRLQKKIIYSNLWPDMLLVYYQINYYCIRYQIDQISEDFDSPLCALYCRCDNILWLYVFLFLDCDASCLTCFGPHAGSCTSCREDHRLEGHGHCVPSTNVCSPRQYADQDGECHPCHKYCHRCSGPGKSHCLSCNQRHLLLSESSLAREFSEVCMCWKDL